MRPIRLAPTFALLMASPALADFSLGPEEYIQAGGSDIDVPGYSVPSLADWNSDGLADLVIGQGSGTYATRVRVYLNSGSVSEPVFTTYFYAQTTSGDLTVPGEGCLGLFPRVIDWDNDGRKDLLIGRGDGRVMLFLNVQTDEDPLFDTGSYLQVGPVGLKVSIDVGARATPSPVDWNGDGRKDLVSGAYDGLVYLFINEGTDAAPDFLLETTAKHAAGGDVDAPSGRSSPAVVDWDADGRKDLLAGNTNGQLVLYRNLGTDQAPLFDTVEYVESGGVPIDLAGTPRSRPFVGDYAGDMLPDVLIGASDGRVHLFESILIPGDANRDGCVDINDLIGVINHWGPCPPRVSACPWDCEDEPDGHVGIDDLVTVINNWS